MIGFGKSIAQNYNFNLHYALDVNFAASGEEKKQIAELDNGNLVLYRFEFDSSVMEHKMRYWCTDPMANVLWNKEFLLGSEDSLFLNGSLCAHDNNFILVFTKVIGNAHSGANIIKCNASGDILESIQLDIPNAHEFPRFSAVYSNNEYVVGGTFHDQTGETAVFIARSNSQSFQNPEIFVTNELEQLSTIYVGENQSLHLIGLHNFETTNVIFNWTTEAVGKKFQNPFYIEEAKYDPNHGTYFAGSNFTDPSYPKAGLMIEDNQGNNWRKEMQITSGISQLSTSSDLIFHNGKVVLTGYCSNPIPRTFITQFAMNGEVEETKTYSSAHPFNYNVGSLLAHSNGHVYLSKLVGVSYTNPVSFATSFICLNPDLDNGCDGNIQTFVHDSIPMTVEADTVLFQEQGTAIVYTQTVSNGALEDTILCHTHLAIVDITSINAELYPNPFTEKTTIRLPEAFSPENTTIRCLDALGRNIPFASSVAGDNSIVIVFEESVKGLVIFYLKNGTQTGSIRGLIE